MNIRCIIYIFTLSLLFPSVKPENNSTINYIHVLFEWDNMDAESYKLIATSNSQTIIDTSITNFFYVDYNNIEWNSTYSWQVCDSSDESICSDTYTFSTGSEIDLGELNITVNYPEQYSDGVTIFGNLTPAFSAAIDKDGRQIWNTGGLNTLCYFNYNENGELFGGKYEDDPINMLPGIEFDINANIIFEEPPSLANPNYAFVQHEIIKINDTQYLFLIPEDQMHPIPSCETTPGCTDSDGEYSWEDDFFEGQPVIWRGEKIILWDTQTNQVEWEWNAFDHISLHDYDFIINWGAVTQLGYYDWTHFNALNYVPEEDAVYVSSRHLSRIYKIALNSYDDLETTNNDETIIWSMGFDPTGNGKYNNANAEEENIKFIELNDSNGNYNGFSFQHGLQILGNGNIVTLDNGNISSLLIEEYDGDNYTRALEISIDEDNNSATIEWEKKLDEYLFGALSGNAQKLENDNYLITTIGNYGHSIEVNNDGDIVSDLQYKINNYVTGTMYRAHRIKSIYPLGCTQLTACNYNSNARVDDGSCLQADCGGECGGNSYLDECNQCMCGPEGYTGTSECDDDDECEQGCDDAWYGDIDNMPIIDCAGICGGSSLDSDSDGICDVDDNCHDNFESWVSNSITDHDSDGCQDETEDLDDDNDNLLDCWTYWYDDGILLSDDEITNMIDLGICEDFALSDDVQLTPTQITLLDAYPNPFNPVVNFDIEINRPENISINIYSINGILTESIYNDILTSGVHSFQWNGEKYPSGLYIINLTWNNNSISKKVVLLK